jgi:hypothetical protein
MFAMAAGYGIAICIATIALIGPTSVARLPVVAQSSAWRMRQREPFAQADLFGRSEIR